jgi:hypothetical protein
MSSLKKDENRMCVLKIGGGNVTKMWGRERRKCCRYLFEQREKNREMRGILWYLFTSQRDVILILPRKGKKEISPSVCVRTIGISNSNSSSDQRCPFLLT